MLRHGGKFLNQSRLIQSDMKSKQEDKGTNPQRQNWETDYRSRSNTKRLKRIISLEFLQDTEKTNWHSWNTLSRSNLTHTHVGRKPDRTRALRHKQNFKMKQETENDPNKQKFKLPDPETILCNLSGELRTETLGVWIHLVSVVKLLKL